MSIQIQGIRQIHKGRFLCYYEIDYINLDGEIKTYEMVSKNPHLTEQNIGTQKTAVSMLVLNKTHNEILILKEFRMGVNSYVYNLPAGMIDFGENEIQAAERELKEETGLKISKIIDILKPSFSCAPIADDTVTLIICEADGKIEKSSSPNEEIYANWYNKEQAIQLLNNNKLKMASKLHIICYCWAKGI